MGIYFQWNCKPLEGLAYSSIKEKERKKRKRNKYFFFCTFFKDDESLGTCGNI